MIFNPPPDHPQALPFGVPELARQYEAGGTLQERVANWMLACFGAEISGDRVERNHRFIEEALELVQACGCTKSETHQLVDYVYDRPQGDINQEVGGVMITLAALCLANGFDMHAAGETELARIWTKIDVIRVKQAAKPPHSPLLEYIVSSLVAPEAGLETTAEERTEWRKRIPEHATYRLASDVDRLLVLLSQVRAERDQAKEACEWAVKQCDNADAREAAVREEEREACAMLVLSNQFDDIDSLAAAIRARSQS